MITDILSDQHLADSNDSCLDCDTCTPNSTAIEIRNTLCYIVFVFQCN